jgi:ketosteroid isomerase-like protein
MRKAVLCLFMVFAGMMFSSRSSFAATPEEEIMQADRDFNTATQQKRADGWMTYFAENAVVPTTPPLAGKAALALHYKKMFANPDLVLSWKPLKAEVFPAGKMGYTVGKYSARYKSTNGEGMEETGRYITVWKKQDDGSWKIVADTGSEDGPARKAK